MNYQAMEGLEQRRLLSLTLLGSPSTVTGAPSSSNFDAAVAGNGQSIVAFATAGDAGDLKAIRYSADGAELGSVRLASGKTISAISTTMDGDGDAVVAWTQ